MLSLADLEGLLARHRADLVLPVVERIPPDSAAATAAAGKGGAVPHVGDVGVRYEGCAHRAQLELLAGCWRDEIARAEGGGGGGGGGVLGARGLYASPAAPTGSGGAASDSGLPRRVAAESVPRRLAVARSRLPRGAAFTRATAIDVLDTAHVLVDTDFTCTHVTSSTPLSFVCFLFAVHRFQRIFVTHSGCLCGYVDPAHLLDLDL